MASATAVREQQSGKKAAQSIVTCPLAPSHACVCVCLSHCQQLGEILKPTLDALAIYWPTTWANFRLLRLAQMLRTKI